MNISFSKYHGAGNDFIIIDDRDQSFPLQDKELISRLCHRRYGIGADGLILYRNSDEADFEMVYFNADGAVGSMCGNGARCIVSWAYANDFISENCSFKAYDGMHIAEVKGENLVSVSMNAEDSPESVGGDYIIDTGSPHYVRIVEDLDQIDVLQEGRKIRYSDRYKEKGINVNFMQDHGDVISMRTYERGVEDETLACGTGTIAVAIVAQSTLEHWKEKEVIPIGALGGELKVSFSKNKFYLEGPTACVFKSEITLES